MVAVVAVAEVIFAAADCCCSGGARRALARPDLKAGPDELEVTMLRASRRRGYHFLAILEGSMDRWVELRVSHGD